MDRIALSSGDVQVHDVASARLYNARTECEGTYLHYISDCYDENNNYCGYDDQAPGAWSEPYILVRQVTRRSKMKFSVA
jgi:hypothetical protein